MQNIAKSIAGTFRLRIWSILDLCRVLLMQAREIQIEILPGMIYRIRIRDQYDFAAINILILFLT
jgi:hypothetical protein